MAKRERMTKAEIAELQERARTHIRSVPYRVSSRWVFYRLLQDGIYKDKGDYKNKWGKQASKFRHDGTWPPDILADETREIIERGVSRAWTEEEILADLLDQDTFKIYLRDSHFMRQDRYVEIWFEARAMSGQFRHYTRDIVLRPFGGMYSIPLKYQAADELAEYARRFSKPATVLYFGDSDDAGKKIFRFSTTGQKGFMKWCDIDVELVWCGLTGDQAVHYGVPENPDKPSEYQWEALTDAQAREIIEGAMSQYVDESLIDEAEAEADAKAAALAEKLRKALDFT